jgi:hypothetical protein
MGVEGYKARANVPSLCVLISRGEREILLIVEMTEHRTGPTCPITEKANS